MKRNFKASPLSLVVKAAIAGALASSAQVHALSWETDNGWAIDLDTTLGYDAQWRMEDPDPRLASDFAAFPTLITNDGNLNFDDGDMTMNKFSASIDLDINYGDGGVFLRGRGWYDDVYNDDEFWDGTNYPNFVPKALGGKPYQKDGIDYHESEVELLDAFLYHTFFFGDRGLNLRAGRQVVNWGESLFINGGISFAQAPLDATKANAPGVELKDIFLPLGQVYAEFDLSETLSMGAYYQWEWEETRIDAAGSFFSVADIWGHEIEGDLSPELGFAYASLIAGLPPTDPSFAAIAAAATPRVVRNDDEDGQWGVALRYLAESLNNTEFGLYYLQYKDFVNTPQYLLIANDQPGDNPLPPPLPAPDPTVFLDHFEDIDLIGASFGTVFGDTNVSGEVSYRDGHPVQLRNPLGYEFVAADIVQAQVSAIHIFGENALMDNLTFTGEVGGNRVQDWDGKGSRALDNDRSAWGAVARLSADYFSVANGLDLKINATYRNDINGESSVLFTFNEGTEQFALKADFNYAGGHSFGAGYVWFLTSITDIMDERNGDIEVAHRNADRDNISVYYKYRF